MSIRRKRRKIKVTKEDQDARRSHALAAGTEITYVICPLCHKSRPLKSYDSRTQFRVESGYAVISVRIGGGDRVGFFRIPERDISINELKNSHPLVFENLKNSVTQLSDLIEKADQ